VLVKVLVVVLVLEPLSVGNSVWIVPLSVGNSVGIGSPVAVGYGWSQMGTVKPN